MNESILLSIKKLLGLAEDYTPFDVDITIHINTFLRRLNQLGCGVDNFSITGSTEKWKDFISDESKWSQAKTYVYIRVRQVFDPPSSSVAMQALNDLQKELEFLLAVEHNKSFDNISSI